MTPLSFRSLRDDDPDPRMRDRRAVRNAVLWLAVRWLLVGVVTAALLVAVLAAMH